MPRFEIVSRFAVAGAMVGLMAGLFEAGLLCFHPRLPGLGAPDVGYIIWVVAPLATLTLLGLFGLLVGGIGALIGNPGRNVLRFLASVILGAGAAYVISSLLLFQALAVDLWFGLNVVRATIIFLVASLAAYLVLESARLGTRFFLGEASTVWRSQMGKTLMASCGILLGILGLYLLPVALGPHGALGARGTSSPSPNIVLITLDTVRADHLSTYGYTRPTTPNLDRLATQGVLFENAYSPSSWTLAAHASMLTGLLPHQHGANWSVPLENYPSTLAEILHAKGYETAGFTANRYFGQAGWGMSQGFKLYRDDCTFVLHSLAVTLVGRALLEPLYEDLASDYFFDRRDAASVNQDVNRWLARRARRPYFLFINYFDAHNPYWAPGSYRRLFGATPMYLESFFKGATEVPRPLSPPERAELVNGYDNCIAYLDSQVGDLLLSLRAQPDWSNTIVIITSDHGEGFGEHGTYGHGFNLYRDVLHVPLIVLGSGIPHGQRLAAVVTTRRLFATVLDLASEGKLPLQKLSLRRSWESATVSPSWPPVISELCPVPQLQNPNAPIAISLMTSEWHFLRNARGQEELYRWPTDPEETDNLVNAPAQQQVREALRNSLFKFTQLSLRPWHGQEYLAALNGLSLLPSEDGLRLQELVIPRGQRMHSVGLAQALFNPTDPRTSTGLSDKDPELLKSIPYE